MTRGRKQEEGRESEETQERSASEQANTPAFVKEESKMMVRYTPEACLEAFIAAAAAFAMPPPLASEQFLANQFNVCHDPPWCVSYFLP